MNKAADITVITATLPERTRVLVNCIESVKRQKLKPAAHLILVDHEQRGESWARNRMLDAAETEWVAFLDDDDVYLPEHLSLLWKKRADYDIVYSWCEEYGGTCKQEFNPDFRQHNRIPVCAPIFKRDVILSVGGFDEGDNRHEDWKLWKKLVAAGHDNWRCVPEVTFKVRPHGQ